MLVPSVSHAQANNQQLKLVASTHTAAMSEVFEIDSIQKPKFRQRSGGNNSDESVTVNRVSDGVNIKALRLRLCRSNITRYLPL